MIDDENDDDEDVNDENDHDDHDYYQSLKIMLRMKIIQNVHWFFYEKYQPTKRFWFSCQYIILKKLSSFN